MSRPILTARRTLGGIPVLLAERVDLTMPAPTVLLYHGWSTRKETQVVTGEALAIDGFRVIMPEAPNHGERDPLPDYGPAASRDYFWPTVIVAVHEAEAIIDAAIGEGIADPNRIGVMGNSMGGMIAAGSLARYDWVKAAVLFNSTPCFEVTTCEWTDTAGDPRPPEEALSVLRAYDPAQAIDRIAPRPVLMLAGTRDSVVPPGGCRRFMELAGPAYSACPDRLQMQETPRLDHYVTADQIMAMRDWFGKYL